MEKFSDYMARVHRETRIYCATMDARHKTVPYGNPFATLVAKTKRTIRQSGKSKFPVGNNGNGSPRRVRRGYFG